MKTMLMLRKHALAQAIGMTLLCSGLSSAYAVTIQTGYSIDNEGYIWTAASTLTISTGHNIINLAPEQSPDITPFSGGKITLSEAPHVKHGAQQIDEVKSQQPTEEPPHFDLEDSYTLIESVHGKYTNQQRLTINQAGLYELILTDLMAPSSLMLYGVTLTKGDTVFAQVFGSGRMLFEAQVGTYAMDTLAKTFTPDQYGQFNLTLSRYESTTAVPAPGALLLLASGLAGLAGVSRYKK